MQHGCLSPIGLNNLDELFPPPCPFQVSPDDNMVQHLGCYPLY